MMRPVLAAMKSREQALDTVQMLERDLEAKNARVRQLEIQPNKQARVRIPLFTTPLHSRGCLAADGSVEG